jgi:CRP/FNR family transcriptional regulator, anaerobic regulatory protein
MEDFRELKQVLFQLTPIPENEWIEFAENLYVKNYEKGEFLIREGQIENHIYFLNKGATRNFFLKDGKEFTVDFHFQGSFVTAYYSFITREPSAVFIELLEETEAVLISHQLLYSFYRKYHHGERIGRLMAEAQYVKRLRKEMDLLSLTAEERYAALLEKNPDLVSTISIKHLSSYLGIQPESLSRIRKMFGRN